MQVHFNDSSRRWDVFPVRAHTDLGPSWFPANKNEVIRYI